MFVLDINFAKLLSSMSIYCLLGSNETCECQYVAEPNLLKTFFKIKDVKNSLSYYSINRIFKKMVSPCHDEIFMWVASAFEFQC